MKQNILSPLPLLLVQPPDPREILLMAKGDPQEPNEMQVGIYSRKAGPLPLGKLVWIPLYRSVGVNSVVLPPFLDLPMIYKIAPARTLPILFPEIVSVSGVIWGYEALSVCYLSTHTYTIYDICPKT